MTEDYTTCSICMEHYDLQRKFPKSLDCRHSLCAPCLALQLESQKCCPHCRRPIDLPENDLTMIDYLERQEHQRRMEQQKAMRLELQTLINTAEKEKDRYKEKINQFKTSRVKIVKDKSQLFGKHDKYLFKKGLHYCNSEATSTRIASKFEEELECSLQDVQTSLLTMKTLLENDYIGREDFDKCQMEATRAIQPEPISHKGRDKILDLYMELLLEQLMEISRDTDPNLIPGNKKTWIIFPSCSTED